VACLGLGYLLLLACFSFSGSLTSYVHHLFFRLPLAWPVMMPSLGAGRWSWSTSRACTLGIRGCSNSASLHPASLSLWSRASSHPIAFSRTGQQPIGGGRRGWRNRFARHKSEELGCPCPQEQKFEAVHSLALWVAKRSAPIRLFRVCFCCWSLLSHVFNSTVDIATVCCCIVMTQHVVSGGHSDIGCIPIIGSVPWGRVAEICPGPFRQI
jgi:hypothetical protein